MKTLSLATFLQAFRVTDVTAAGEFNEIELGFETMLSHDVVEFLKRDCKPLVQLVRTQQYALLGLDEHELAMV